MVLPAATLFPSGGYQLAPDARLKLKTLADGLRQVPGLVEIEVVGHTDGQPPPHGAEGNNFTLSSMRAGAIAGVLIDFGVDKKKLVVRGMGDLKPLLPERTADGRPDPANMAKNRRVNLLLKVRRNHGALRR